jgi:thioredoxin-dependent peroxiredoxin
MAEIKFKGSPIHTGGDLPAVGSPAPEFHLTKGDLGEASLATYAGKKKILNIVPSLDTGVCATSAKRFEKEVEQLPNTVVLTISRDLPFAQKRFCAAESVEKVIPLSEMRDRAFGAKYGVEMIDGPLAGLLSRAIVVIDENDKVTYVEQVPEITQEPDYESALKAVR